MIATRLCAAYCRRCMHPLCGWAWSLAVPAAVYGIWRHDDLWIGIAIAALVLAPIAFAPAKKPGAFFSRALLGLLIWFHDAKPGSRVVLSIAGLVTGVALVGALWMRMPVAAAILLVVYGGAKLLFLTYCAKLPKRRPDSGERVLAWVVHGKRAAG